MYSYNNKFNVTFPTSRTFVCTVDLLGNQKITESK